MNSTRREAMTALAAFMATKKATVAEIKPEPGEVFVITVPQRLDADEIEKLCEHWKSAWGDNAPKTLLLYGGATLSVAKRT